jgi:hypothetical protein
LSENIEIEEIFLPEAIALELILVQLAPFPLSIPEEFFRAYLSKIAKRRSLTKVEMKCGVELAINIVEELYETSPLCLESRLTAASALVVSCAYIAAGHLSLADEIAQITGATKAAANDILVAIASTALGRQLSQDGFAYV